VRSLLPGFIEDTDFNSNFPAAGAQVLQDPAGQNRLGG
jgi:hypothetical protein